MIAAIIQARMSSKRLPGKILKKVLDKPLLLYQIEQIRYCKKVDKIIVATSENKSDDEVEGFCKKESVLYFRGSEEDVMERFYKTALFYKVDLIVRLTADCPLIDPEAVDLAVSYHIKKNCDFTYLGLSFAEGICCDIFSVDLLKEAFEKAVSKPEREHVTPYFHNNANRLKVAGLENKSDDSKYRFVVDKVEDFEVVKKIIESLSFKKNNYFKVQDIKKFLNENPDIFKLNSNIIRNEQYNVFEKK